MIPNTHKYPHRFHQWNRAHQGAYRKGVSAYLAGTPLTDCPYIDHRKPSGSLSWSRAFINSWRDGWMDAKQQHPKPQGHFLAQQ